MLLPRKAIIAVLTMGVLTAIAALRGADLYWRRAEIVKTSGQRAANLASILSEYMRGTFAAGDASLRQLALHSRRIGGPGADDADWAPSLASARAGLSGVGSISISDAQGIIRHSTVPLIIGQSRRDQYLFRRLSTDSSDAFVVNTPFMTLTEPRQLVIPVGRRLTTADGAFDGIVAITFTPAALETFFRTIDVGTNGVVWVLHPDGIVLVREPSVDHPIGHSSQGNALFQAAQTSSAGVVDAAVEPGGPEMLSAFQVSITPPLDRRRLTRPPRGPRRLAAPGRDVDRRLPRARVDDGRHAGRALPPDGRENGGRAGTRARAAGRGGSSEAGERATGQRARDRAGGTPRNRSRGAAEGRVRDDGLARAAHAAHRDHRLGADAGDRQAEPEADGVGHAKQSRGTRARRRG